MHKVSLGHLHHISWLEWRSPCILPTGTNCVCMSEHNIHIQDRLVTLHKNKVICKLCACVWGGWVNAYNCRYISRTIFRVVVEILPHLGHTIQNAIRPRECMGVNGEALQLHAVYKYFFTTSHVGIIRYCRSMTCENLYQNYKSRENLYRVL